MRNVKTKKSLKGVDNYRGYVVYHCIKDDGKQHVLSRHRAVALAWIDNSDTSLEINHIDRNQFNNYYKNLEWCTRDYNQSYDFRDLRLSQIGFELKGKIVYLYDLEGNKIAIVFGVNRCATLLQTPKTCFSDTLYKNLYNNDKLYTIKNYIPSFCEIEKKDFLIRRDNTKNISQKNNPKLSKKVYQYTINKKFIREYPSLHEAARQMNKNSTSTIRACCAQKIKQAYGYIWSYTPL